MLQNLHLGTCSWKYPSWEGLVYRSSKPDNILTEYAKKYSAVEIDQWFWSLFGVDKVVLPKPAIVAEYSQSVPEDFRFVVKAPNSLSLTHIYKHYTAGELVKNPHFLSPDLYTQFLYSIKDLHPKIGAISLQFEYLNQQKMPSSSEFLASFVHFLKEVDSHIPLNIELRNPNFLTPRYFDTLRELGIGHTFCQGYYMPSIIDVYDDHAHQIQGTQIIRLLGSDRQGMDKQTGKVWNKVVAPKDAEIKGIADLIKRMLDQSGIDLYLNVNNHYEGSAPITIDKLLQYL